MKVSGFDGMRSSCRSRSTRVRHNPIRLQQRRLVIEHLEQRALLDASAISLPVPGEVAGELEAADDFDVYEVTPGAGEHLIVQLNGDSHDSNELYIRYGDIPDPNDPSKYDAAGIVTGHADQFVEVAQTQAGNYFVLVRCTYLYGTDPSDYAIRADTLATLPRLEIGVQADGTLNAYDFDIYQVEPGDDQHLVVQFNDASSHDENALYIRYGAVPDWSDPAKYDAAGTVVNHADQFVEISETQTGTYFVLAHCTYNYGTNPNDYAIRADTLATLPRLEIGIQADDAFNAYDFDIYQVEPGDDQHLVVQFNDASSHDENALYIRYGAVPDWSDPAKYDAAGTVVNHADQFVEIPETQTGTYFVLAHCTYNYGTDPNDYAIRADTLATLPRLEIGVQADGTLNAYDFDIYQVEPGDDQHLVVQFNDASSHDENALYIRYGAVPDWSDPTKYDAAGTVVNHADQFVEIPETQTGTYFVLAHCTYNYGTNPNDYAIRADTLATLPRLEIGIQADDAFNAYDFDIYQVEPGDDQHLVVQFNDASSHDENALYIRYGAVPDWSDPAKYDAAGTVVNHADQFVEIPETQTGTYFVLAHCTYNYGTDPNDYAIRADTLATLPRLIPGVNQSGEFSSGDFAIYRMYVGADQQIRIQFDDTDNSDQNELYIRRDAVPVPDDPTGYDAAGKEPGVSDQYLEIADTEDGVYYVLVRCTYDSDGGDAYTLRADLTPPWPGFGAAGDSLTDEYPLGVSSTWVELLAATKGINFGPQIDWGAPRNEGYEYNWARLGATSATLLAEGQHIGLAQQMAAGAVNYAVLAIGQNDFAPGTSAYQGIYSGIWTQSQTDLFVDGVVDNIETALNTLVAPGGNLIMTNVIDFGLAPVTQLLYPSSTSRARVTSVLEALNNRLEGLASEFGLPLVDTFQLAQDFIGTGSTAAEQIGGVTLQIATGLDPHNVFVDGIHPHTIVQGALGNVFLEAFAVGYGLDVSSIQFSEQELLAVAGIGNQYVEDSLTLTYSDYVILPNTFVPIDLGTVDFSQLADLSLSEGALWYQFTTTRRGQLTAVASTQSGTVAAALYDLTPTEPPLAQSAGTTARLDHSVQTSETYLLKLSGDSNNFALTLANLVATEGTQIHVFGTANADLFEFAPSASYDLTINGVGYHFDDTKYETIVFDGGIGDDAATLTGSSGSEVARFFPNHGSFGENGFLVTVNEVTAITAYGGGGYDSAFMYDSPSDDEFVTRKGYGKLAGEGFAIETFDFMVNYGYATNDGNDIAYMEDTDGKDKFKFDWPNPGQFFGKMYGGGIYYNRAKFFEQIFATMSNQNDTARLFDSEGDEVFYGQKSESRLVGTGFDVTVSGYGSLIAYASQGNDIAYLEDSADDDTTRAHPHKIIFWGQALTDPTYELTARKFDEYHFEAKNGGFDRAKLHDSVFDDHVEVDGNTTRVWMNRDGQLDLLYEVIDFEWVKLYTTDTGSHDTLEKKEPINFELLYEEAMWDVVP